MSKRLYVGNLPYSTSDAELKELFSNHGDVTDVHIVLDRDSGRPRGFAFVEMADGGDEAISALNGHSLGGRNLTVNEARPRANQQRPRW